MTPAIRPRPPTRTRPLSFLSESVEHVRWVIVLRDDDRVRVESREGFLTFLDARQPPAAAVRTQGVSGTDEI